LGATKPPIQQPASQVDMSQTDEEPQELPVSMVHAVVLWPATQRSHAFAGLVARGE
jgi:hypothetical protein